MRVRSVSASLGFATVVLATLMGSADAQPQRPVATFEGSPAMSSSPDGGESCGRNFGAPNGAPVSAQEFGPGYDSFDSFAAADFKLKRNCQVREIYVDGESNGQANGISLAIYRKFGTLPDLDRPICIFPFKPGAGPDFLVAVHDDGCELVRRANYWLQVQVDQDFESQGQWFWATTTSRIKFEDAWYNPGDAFGTPCDDDYDTLGTCFGPQLEGRDFIFDIRK